MKTKAHPYSGGRLGTLSKLHFKVIHGEAAVDPESFTDMEGRREDREMSRLSATQANLVCPTCFPLLSNKPHRGLAKK